MRDDKFAVAGPMADRAIVLGRTQAAVDILHYPLASVLDDIRNGRTVTPEMRELAVEYACKLATATRDGRWIDYAFELLCVASEPYNDEVAAMLDCAVRRARSVSTLRIEHYLAGLTLLPVTWQRIRTGQHSESLIRIAREKRP
jgi:hypothetical protein